MRNGLGHSYAGCAAIAGGAMGILLAPVMVIIKYMTGIHTWTWHQNGLTTPTPGTNPVANTAYAVHMMGMNFVMVGAMTVGVSAWRRRFLAYFLATGKHDRLIAA